MIDGLVSRTDDEGVAKHFEENYIPYLINDEGERIEDQQNMCRLVKEYYLNVFASPCTNRATSTIIKENEVNECYNECLISNITFEEFEVAIKQMDPDKASGPNGLNPGFFQQCFVFVGHINFQFL